MLSFLSILSGKFTSNSKSLDSHINKELNDNLDDCSQTKEPEKTDDKTGSRDNFEITNFKLPIEYLEPDEIHSLSNVVSNDLELSNNQDGSNNTMYDYAFKPNHIFSKKMISKWNSKYTTNNAFLNDTQNVLKSIHNYKSEMMNIKHSVKCEKLIKIWKDVKQDESFMEKYNFIEWNILKHLNYSESFLQCFSVINILSPLISLIIPIIFLIFPFLLLKLQRIPITFSVYLDVLKSIAKNHFIGKTLMNIQSLSWDKIIYILITFSLYVLQIYQNVMSCYRFYNNIQKMNDYLYELRDYTKYSIDSMESFANIIKDYDTYSPFYQDLKLNCHYLQLFNKQLNSITPFRFSVSKFSSIGYMLKSYYEFYSNKTYENALQFSFGFEGYINNLLGLHSNINDGFISYADFEEDAVTDFKDQYYPPLMDQLPVKNSCKFDKNMIISSPNKSGKTTILKTTTINIIFTQQFGCGFYKSAKLTPYSHIHSYLNIPDTSGRDSLFQAESRRCKEIIDNIKLNSGSKCRHFCIFDELYSGTNPEEASKAGHAFLKYLNGFSNVDYILTTHYFAICNKFKKSKQVQNYKMEVNILKDGTFEYTYKIKKGVSKIKGGIRVLKDMDYPDEIIDTIENQ